MFTWWHRYKQQRAIDLLEAEIEKAKLLLMSIERAQREYDRMWASIKPRLSNGGHHEN